MKKIFTVAGVLLCCISLAGCGKNDISLTTEQNDLVAEYIAGTLLKYSYENEWKYQKLNSAGNTYTGTGNKNTTQAVYAGSGRFCTADNTGIAVTEYNTGVNAGYIFTWNSIFVSISRSSCRFT